MQSGIRTKAIPNREIQGEKEWYVGLLLQQQS